MTLSTEHMITGFFITNYANIFALLLNLILYHEYGKIWTFWIFSIKLFQIDQVSSNNLGKMEQPTAPQQVIYIIQMPKERITNIKESYVVKAATTLGVIHIVCGIAVLIASITGLVFNVFSIGEVMCWLLIID